MEQAGALALILGTVAMIGVMALHPSGHVSGHAGEVARILRLGVVVHAIAIGAAPLLTFGFFALTHSIGFDKPLASLALVIYAFGAVAVMLAATMSGLVAPKLIELQMANAGGEQPIVHGLAQLEWFMNQSFATLHVALFSVAIALWALAWPDKGVLGSLIQISGLVVGIGIFAWLVSGTLELNVHGMGAVVLAQGAWTILAGVALARRRA